MSALRRGENREALIRRAGMDGYGFNTGVVRATDSGPRIAVNGPLDNAWGDCVAVGFMPEGQNLWTYSHLSPARARILAMHLLRVAAMKERSHMGRIDRIEPRGVGEEARPSPQKSVPAAPQNQE